MKKLKPGKDYIGVGGGVLIFNKMGEVFLAQRGGKARNESGLWSQPGGKVRFGEKAAAAVKREIKEENDIDIRIWGYAPYSDHIIKKENHHWMAINFLADLKAGVPKIMEPHKCSDIGWFNLKKLPKKINQPTRESIKNYLAGKYIKI